ncbi:hypothetical protein ACFOU0_12290 [Salinicoccus sesuvii]|uniref:Uncharacterized protein n=1 Tax=Salinicoccus sesuvii TaxID=868281 RepID=A0ABV7N8D2_9STAP
MSTYFQNLRHLYLEDVKFATAIPRKDHIKIFAHLYQDILLNDIDNLSDEAYRTFITDHGYVEKTTKGVIKPLEDLSALKAEMEPSAASVTKLSRPDQMDIFKFIEN